MNQQIFKAICENFNIIQSLPINSSRAITMRNLARRHNMSTAAFQRKVATAFSWQHIGQRPKISAPLKPFQRQEMLYWLKSSFEIKLANHRASIWSGRVRLTV